MNSNKKMTLKDFEINIKIKLAGLWTATTFCYLYGDYFELYTPGKIDSLITGQNVLGSPMILLIASLILTIPPLMIAFSLILNAKMNRLLNIISGSLFTLMMILIAIGSLTAWYSFYVFLALVEATFTFIIVLYAIKWPKSN